jgi:predicted ATP-dependent serine protease
MNDHLILISGKSATGKSTSLMFMDDPKSVMYLNCESGKKLPFKSRFEEYVITDPMQVIEAIEASESMDHIKTIVVDSLTYLMDMYESNYVLTSSNTMKALNVSAIH